MNEKLIAELRRRASFPEDVPDKAFLVGIRYLLTQAADALESTEYEYALIDNSPTAWYGHMYAIGYSEAEVRALAEMHGDTLMRRVKSGKWEEA